MPALFWLVRGRRRRRRLAIVALVGMALTTATTAQAAERPAAAVLLDRLCTVTMRPNEEDRLYGLISLTVRATIKYRDGVFSPDLVDDAVQDALTAMLDACRQISATDDEQRLGMVVGLIRDATVKRLQDGKTGYSAAQTEKATAADLSEELSAPEIDAWLDALPARQRTLALFLYAGDLNDAEMARAVGLPPGGLAAGFRGVKGDLLKFYRADWEAPLPPSTPQSPAIEYRRAGDNLAALLAPEARPGEARPGEAKPPDATPPAKPVVAARSAVRITGISREVYAGWSLLASVTGLPPERSLDLAAPVLLEPDDPGRRRMLAVALQEISDPHDETRRFLVKAYAIDADKDGAGLHDGFHPGAAFDNAEAAQTLRNRSLAAIETARCLWHDFGTGPDPGLCR